VQEKKMHTSIYGSSFRFKKFVRVDTGRGVRTFDACDLFSLRSW